MAAQSQGGQLHVSPPAGPEDRPTGRLAERRADLGFGCTSKISAVRSGDDARHRLTVTLTTAFMALSNATRNPFAGVSSYLFFLFGFEVCYTWTNNETVLNCRERDIGFIASARNGCATLAMIVVIAFGGWLADHIGFVRMALSLAVMGAVVMGYLDRRIRGSQVRPEALGTTGIM